MKPVLKTGDEHVGPPPLMQMRSLLFVPAHKARAIEKARDLACDLMMIDLEDAVPADEKQAGRDNIRAAAGQGFAGRPWAVRINADDAAEHGLDMVLVREVRPDFVVLPKVSTARQAHDVYAVCQTPLIAMIETPVGVIAAQQIAAQSGVAALLVGTNDLRHELRIPAVAGRDALSFALQNIVLAARAQGCAVFDGVFNRFDDATAFAAECTHGRQLGFDGKSLIHPSQIEPANRLFGPDAEELAAARALIAAYQGGAQGHGGAMIEQMHVDAAKALLARAGEGPGDAAK